jgi:hypothetical protein
MEMNLPSFEKQMKEWEYKVDGAYLGFFTGMSHKV